ncbi:diguanylate cyclase [Heliobacillus mobilis]|uniref:Diguanylate cyclase n=1 Tax=Heliobacterium mobile TaxID=28064 RepID=A0A6I3SPA5_HELMO|nr:diguanylate cyclase [Heliobacterium mobile]MTV50893.1 diguanylate cyclase [Heliobacterium mobile]
MRRSLSLRTYFSISFGILIVIMSGILSIAIGNRSIEQVKSEIGNSLAETAYQMADKMDAFMWSRSGEVYTLSQLEALHNFQDTKAIQNLLEKLKEIFPSFSWIGLTNSEGIVIASTQSILSGVDISKRPVFMERIKGKFIGDVHDAVLLAKLLPNPYGEAMKFVDVSIPITDRNGNSKGVLAAHLSWEWANEIEKSILEPLHNRQNIEMLVISSKDNTVLLGRKDMIGKTINTEIMKIAREGKNRWSVENWDDGKTYLTGYAVENGYMDYKGLGWTIIVRQPLQDAYARVRDLQLFIILVGVFCSIVFSTICWFIAGKISSPIQKISMSAEKLGLGEQVQIPQYSGIKEIEMLSVSLRELISSLMRSNTALGEMETVAHHDHLTGIPNRTGLEKYLESATKTSRLKGTYLTCLCLDLDGFKSVNDTYGHHSGDVLLQEVANRLTKNTRSDEIVARLGGDEFVVVIQTSSSNPVEDGYALANRIITELNQTFVIEGHTVHVGCSVGGNIWKGDQDIHEILKKADEALYSSKKTGKNRATFYNADNTI